MAMRIAMAKYEYWRETSDPRELQYGDHDEPQARAPDLIIDSQQVVIPGELIKAVRRSKYDLLEGGHAPRELRRCFDRTVRAFLKFERRPVHYRGVEVDCADFIPVLWNCVDPLPDALVRALQAAEFGWLLPPGIDWIYGNLARAVWEYRQGRWGTIY